MAIHCLKKRTESASPSSGHRLYPRVDGSPLLAVIGQSKDRFRRVAPKMSCVAKLPTLLQSILRVALLGRRRSLLIERPTRMSVGPRKSVGSLTVVCLTGCRELLREADLRTRGQSPRLDVPLLVPHGVEIPTVGPATINRGGGEVQNLTCRPQAGQAQRDRLPLNRRRRFYPLRGFQHLRRPQIDLISQR